MAALEAIEQESIYLLAVWESIDSMVNYGLLDIAGDDPGREIRFKERAHQQLFNILLVDFLSMTDSKGPVPSQSYLGALENITRKPQLAPTELAVSLLSSVMEFRAWLNTKVTVDVWLSTIGKQLELQLTRWQFLKMAGNTSKHNFLRLARVAGEFETLIQQSGFSVNGDEALLALTDFHKRFHDDILNYHSSTICEFLNNIRWGIYEYLRDATKSRFIPGDDGIAYRWKTPDGINDRYAYECHWNLMNAVRSPPYMSKFQVTKWLKLRY